MSSMTERLDGAAITLSAACFVHCLILPIAATALPILGIFAEAEWVHWVFVALAIPTSLLSLRSGPSASRALLVARLLACVGLLGLLLGALGWPEHEWETGLTVAGGLTLATGHGINLWRKSRVHKAHL